MVHDWLHDRQAPEAVIRHGKSAPIHHARAISRRSRAAILGSAIAIALITLLAGTKRPRSAPLGPDRLSDGAHFLTPADRALLEQRLTTAARRVGSPVYLHITERLHHETAPRMAERLLAERVSAENLVGNPVLLLVVTAQNSAAIATGKGNAGIVPEMDGHQILEQLLAHDLNHQVTGPLSRALDAIAVSAENTAARRRPLAADEDDPPPAAGDARAAPSAKGSAPPAATPPAKDAPASLSPGQDLRAPGLQEPPQGDEITDPQEAGDDPVVPPPSPSRSRLPIAIGIAVLILVALGLRRRRSVTAARRDAPGLERGKPQLPSVIDRPPRPPASRRR